MITTFPLLKNLEYDSAYSAIMQNSKEIVYFALCTHIPGKNAGFFSLDLDTSIAKKLFDISDVVKSNLLSQKHGKIHTQLIEGEDKKIYFGTHFAYPYGIPQNISYEGGRLISYDPSNGKLFDFGIPKKGEGIISISMDLMNMQAYILTIPSGYLIRCDIETQRFYSLGKIPSKGSICRNTVIDSSGNLYGSYENNGIFIYNLSKNKLEYLDNILPYHEIPEWNTASRGGVNKLGRKLWRCAVYDLKSNFIYGVLGSTSHMFSFDCINKKIIEYMPLVSNKDRRRLNEIFPTLSLVLNRKNIYYAPASGFFDYCRSEKLNDWSYLFEFDEERKIATNLGLLSDGKKRVFGVAGSTTGINNEFFYLGAIEKIDKNTYNPLNIINQRPFDLGIIKIAI